MVRCLLIWSLWTAVALADDSLDEFLYGMPPTPDASEPVDDRPILEAYTATWCGPCRGLKGEIEKAKNLPFRVRWHDVDREQFPGDVPPEIPHVEWADRKWYAKPDNLADLIGKFERSREPKPKAAKPVNPVPGHSELTPAAGTMSGSGQVWSGKGRKAWKWGKR